jgi:hypothetical protein
MGKAIHPPNTSLLRYFEDAPVTRARGLAIIEFIQYHWECIATGSLPTTMANLERLVVRIGKANHELPHPRVIVDFAAQAVGYQP